MNFDDSTESIEYKWLGKDFILSRYRTFIDVQSNLEEFEEFIEEKKNAVILVETNAHYLSKILLKYNKYITPVASIIDNSQTMYYFTFSTIHRPFIDRLFIEAVFDFLDEPDILMKSRGSKSVINPQTLFVERIFHNIWRVSETKFYVEIYREFQPESKSEF